MKNLLFALLLTTLACGKDDTKSSDAIVADAPVSEEAPAEAETPSPEAKTEVGYESPLVVDNPAPLTVTAPVADPAPVSEAPIIAQKIAEMDAMIQDRINLLLAWNIWDDYRSTNPINHSSPQYLFQLDTSHPWMKVNNLFGQHSTFLDHSTRSISTRKIYHCDELVDAHNSELSVYYTGRDQTEKSMLNIQVYFYTPKADGPIYITKIKLNWKFSNGAEQESVKEARCK